VNVSRYIIYSDTSDLFEEKVRIKALKYKEEMEKILIERNLI
jgi:hypothetical protein